MADEKPSPEWDVDAVVQRLHEKTRPGKPSHVQVFVSDQVAAEDLPAKARQIVEEASAGLALAPDAVRIGKVHRLARSFSVISDVPRVFDAIARRDEVTSMLDSEQPDILPKPVGRTPVP